MALELHVWKITGVSPLLQNNPSCMKSGSDEGMTAGKKKYDDKEEAEMRVYRNSDGHPFHPTAAFRSCMLQATSGKKINKVWAKAIFASSVFPAEVEGLLVDKSDKPLKNYEIHKCRVVVGKQGVLRCRPKWSGWYIKLALEVDVEFISTKAITEILTIAGRVIGIGDNRPDTSKGKSGVGTFGRFTAEFVK